MLWPLLSSRSPLINWLIGLKPIQSRCWFATVNINLTEMKYKLKFSVTKMFFVVEFLLRYSHIERLFDNDFIIVFESIWVRYLSHSLLSQFWFVRHAVTEYIRIFNVFTHRQLRHIKVDVMLFACDIFNDAISSSNNTPSNDRLINE